MSIAKPILLVQGMQWGSEAKGTVAAWLCLTRDVDYAVRTGGVNAGHTVVYKDKTYKMQQLPTGWINPHTKLVLGAGAYVNIEILEREMKWIDEVFGPGNAASRLYIDMHAGLHTAGHQHISAITDRHTLLGATGKGVSEAIVDKVKNRGRGAKLLIDVINTEEHPWITGAYWCDTSELLNDQYDKGSKILIEATQGHWLDLHYGPWPYTTGKQTLAATWLAECGLSPALKYEIVGVVRTYPIRVAGNSGPMSDEISWPILARSINTKLVAAGLEPRIPEASIQMFELQVRSCAEQFNVPPQSDGLDQHLWSEPFRKEYASTLSNLHAVAMERLKKYHRADYDNLTRLYEFTTVTNKLRRIARLNLDDLKMACLRDRPSWLAVTFLNYEFPQIWDTTYATMMTSSSKDDITAIKEYFDEITRRTGVPVGMYNTGPELRHVVDLYADHEHGVGQ